MAEQSAQDMRDLVKQGKAMPAPGDTPGRYPIENRQDLQNAILAVGRVRPNTDAARAAVRRFILKRATELNLGSIIPPNWNPDGSLKS
jgi:hypothetical protein